MDRHGAEDDGLRLEAQPFEMHGHEVGGGDHVVVEEKKQRG